MEVECFDFDKIYYSITKSRHEQSDFVVETIKLFYNSCEVGRWEAPTAVKPEKRI